MLIAVPVALAGFGVVSVGLLILGQFHTYHLIPAGIAIVGLVVYILWAHQQKKSFYKVDKETSLGIVIGLCFIVAWVGYNLAFNSEHVFINRDPGIYAVTAKIIQNQPNLTIDKVETQNEGSGLFSSAAGFGNSAKNSGDLFAQGAHLLPTLLGFVSRIFGDQGIFNGNVVFGGFALLSFFAFCLNFIRAKFALLATVSLSLTLPFIYFSRDSYSEILALCFTFGSLTLIYHAINSKNRSLWLLAGITLGAGALTRIDAYLSMAAIIVFITAYLILQRKKLERVDGLKNITIFITGIVMTAIVGFLDVKLLADGYFISEWRYISLEMYLILTLLILSAISVFFLWKKGALNLLDQHTKRWRAPVLAGFVILFWVFAGSRFLWMDSPRQSKAAEMMVPFIGAYLGPVMLTFGIFGLGLLVYRISNSKKLMLDLMPFAIIIVTTALLYVTRPSISSDHVWASRRVLPIVIPGLIFAGMYLFSILYKRFGKQTKHKVILWCILLAMVISPLVMTYRFIALSPFKQYAALEAVCDAIPKDATVIWLGRAGMDATIATRAYCGVDSLRYQPSSEMIDQDTLAKTRASLKKGVLMVGAHEKDADKLGITNQLTQVSRKITDNVELVYSRPPTKILHSDKAILMGIVDENGQIKKIGNRDEIK